ncbi:hypothetical protein AJ78_06709 [Emergomyces pasteurianus Ep9510]|uniref:FAD/NAD(P)-binding domain-containing protein n=1 Tax=Emergomyces pasteurianus Ep9510 TaxID=1447872 RepID=A0A1J9PXW6_9EURO|nr:hypothetical protein AJ78_06709 [Emergomyces pasteurianus Ep9510]
MNGHTPPANAGTSDFDVLIIGAGISGINTAYRIQSELPDYRYAILEGRNAIGGTWDLFRYPGIRSDSDLFTFGFAWNPWNQDKPIAEGHALKAYMQETVQKFGIDEHILFHQKVLVADWSSTTNRWTLQVDDNQGGLKTYTARFVAFGTGYYNYNEPLDAGIPGMSSFKGQTVHPQFWPENLDYTNKKVVIIGSGATAVTLFPNIAKSAAHTTMLQRSPTYILAMANRGSLLSHILPGSLHRKIQRILWILTSRLFYTFCQGIPWLARRILKLSVSARLPKHIPHDPHFAPSYNPWDQRLCVCPDGDFFKSLHTGRADVKTDTIKQVTETGIELNSGEHLDADIIVTATGLKLQIAGGIRVTVDGKQTIHIPDKYMWNGVMVQDVPNASFLLGYANASWTLGADATALFIVRLLKHMEKQGLVAAVPRLDAGDASTLEKRRLLALSSTYVSRAENAMPKAANRKPWLPRGNYFVDYWFAKYGRIDECLETVKGEGEGVRLVDTKKKQ